MSGSNSNSGLAGGLALLSVAGGFGLAAWGLARSSSLSSNESELSSPTSADVESATSTAALADGGDPSGPGEERRHRPYTRASDYPRARGYQW